MATEDSLDLGEMFTEPPRPPTPEPTISTYNRDQDKISPDSSWDSIKIRLVGSHPLWAHHLWNAALALASHLDEHRELYSGKCVLELGAGGALPSIVAAKNGARKVVITDYPDASLVDNISYNVAENVEAEERSRVEVQGYIWGRSVTPLLDVLPSPGKFQLIILSDLIFNHSQHDALLNTCELVLEPLTPNSHEGTEPCVLVFYSHHRPHLAHRDMEFFTKAEERGWICKETPMFPEDSGEESVRSTVHGWKLTKPLSS
ncbi:Protein N-terminal and lysine N-methyltransferase EFM7 [Psilocybe cubensis]|uniref:Protein N-terminal and lysine N-methyltransferase EFM7 n=2 Tax=Psilocybe cubensis TaxID=181762 RepID=A0ACB8GIW2_PSICU|nr:Protein N-terminal and lysine N-methyltransferase EFM7 [Psilocybe cubensis]KAH9475539.1 Protein N-terminal and lysine N-methyltransferase EFM7 [Psilocybe cubensis]